MRRCAARSAEVAGARDADSGLVCGVHRGCSGEPETQTRGSCAACIVAVVAPVLKKQAYGTHEALHAWHHGSPRCQLWWRRLGNNLCYKRLMGSRSQVRGGGLARLGIDAAHAHVPE